MERCRDRTDVVSSDEKDIGRLPVCVAVVDIWEGKKLCVQSM